MSETPTADDSPQIIIDESNSKKKHIHPSKMNKTSVVDWFKYDPVKNIEYDIKSGKQLLRIQNNKKVDDLTAGLNNLDNDLILSSNEEATGSDNLKSTTQQMTNIKQKKVKSKKQLYNEFMSKINEEFTYDDSDDEEDLDICQYCNNEMLLEQNTGTLLCVTCGTQEQVLIDSDKPSYKDPPKEMTSFCYKRINYTFFI